MADKSNPGVKGQLAITTIYTLQPRQPQASLSRTAFKLIPFTITCRNAHLPYPKPKVKKPVSTNNFFESTL